MNALQNTNGVLKSSIRLAPPNTFFVSCNHVSCINCFAIEKK